MYDKLHLPDFRMSIKMAVTLDYRHNNIRYFSSKMHI